MQLVVVAALITLTNYTQHSLGEPRPYHPNVVLVIAGFLFCATLYI